MAGLATQTSKGHLGLLFKVPFLRSWEEGGVAGTKRTRSAGACGRQEKPPALGKTLSKGPGAQQWSSSHAAKATEGKSRVMLMLRASLGHPGLSLELGSLTVALCDARLWLCALEIPVALINPLLAEPMDPCPHPAALWWATMV